MARVALRIAYDGTRFAGSQRQPDQRTVEGEVLFALRKIGALEEPREARFQCASRTDRGVSAVGNIVAFDTPFRLDALLPAAGAAMRDVWPHGVCEVPDDFEARRARARTYLYFLPAAGVRPGALLDALRAFEGTHDFTRFARLEPGVPPTRTVHEVGVRAAQPGEPFHAITVEGESFLWNQVRRMVSAAERVARGEARLQDLEAGLRGEPVDLGTAPAEHLVLLDVHHGLAWRSHPAALEAALRELGARILAAQREAHVLDALRRGIAA